MTKLKQEVERLERNMFHTWIYFLDKSILKRIVELREHFSEEIIMHVEDRIKDPRTNKQIRAILDNHMRNESRVNH